MRRKIRIGLRASFQVSSTVIEESHQRRMHVPLLLAKLLGCHVAAKEATWFPEDGWKDLGQRGYNRELQIQNLRQHA